MGERSPYASAVRAAIARSAEQCLLADDALRAGATEEAIHRARIATRRLRSDLKTFRPLLVPAWSDPLAAGLRTFAGALGAVRDADVVAATLRDSAQSVPRDDQALLDGLWCALDHRRRAARAELIVAMEAAEHEALLDRLRTAAAGPAFLDGVPRGKKRARRAARTAWRRVVESADRLDGSADPSSWHEARKRAKRARYALEAIAPLRVRGAAALARRLTDVQQVLGAHQDAVVAREFLAGTVRAGLQPAACFALGELAGVLLTRQGTIERRWPAVWRAARRQVL
jgi:CHAD domain-containing protein